jgi:hypothetical protein
MMNIVVLLGAQPTGGVERWQTDYLPVFAGWAIVALLALAPLFGFP